jgi:hypothetical protein
VQNKGDFTAETRRRREEKNPEKRLESAEMAESAEKKDNTGEQRCGRHWFERRARRL